MAGATRWESEFATYWAVITGPKFYNTESIRRAVEPAFREYFIKPSRWAAAGVPIIPQEIVETSSSTRQGVRIDVSSGTVVIVGGIVTAFAACSDRTTSAPDRPADKALLAFAW